MGWCLVEHFRNKYITQQLHELLYGSADACFTDVYEFSHENCNFRGVNGGKTNIEKFDTPPFNFLY